MHPVDSIIEKIRQQFHNQDSELVDIITGEQFEQAIYREVVELCAAKVDHILVWNGSLGDHIRKEMKVL